MLSQISQMHLKLYRAHHHPFQSSGIYHVTLDISNFLCTDECHTCLQLVAKYLYHASDAMFTMTTRHAVQCWSSNANCICTQGSCLDDVGTSSYELFRHRKSHSAISAIFKTVNLGSIEEGTRKRVGVTSCPASPDLSSAFGIH